MTSTSTALSGAEVLWWDKSSVGVRCHFCDDIHMHGFTGYDPKHSIRVCHCACRESYQFVFPFNETRKQAYYTIDKKRALFVTAGANPADYFKDEEGHDHSELLAEISQKLDTKRKWCDATETCTIDCSSGGPFEQKLLLFIVSDMVCGRVGSVKQYLESSKEADLFLHGIDARKYIDYRSSSSLEPDDADSGDVEQGQEDAHEIYSSGSTALHLVACEDHADMVQLLLDKGADPNARDNEGRTPLAHACLWGRLENVRHLLKHGADTTIPFVRGSDLLLPIDYARESKDNVETRHWTASVYKEDSYERNKDRKIIVALLNDPADRQHASQAPGEPRKLWNFAFTRAPHDSTMLTMSAHFDIDTEWKTVGVLWRGGKFPTVAAMSGWSRPEYGNTRIAGRDWTDKVRHLMNAFPGFGPQLHSRDRDFPGQYYACHAEKQLVAYFLDQHHFLPYDEADPDGEECWPYSEREILMRIEPPVTVHKAEIMVSRPVCTDCSRFVQHINVAMKVDISLISRPC